MTQPPTIIVVTPVRNEAWILERFLTVSSQFADVVLLLDQNSTDGSIEIAQRFPKVRLLRNESATFNEAERQIALLKAARDSVPGPRLIMALDADEILAADATSSPGWRQMLSSAPGTAFYFDKPTFLGGFDQAIRYSKGFPLAYMDDGALHQPSQIHSTRIPASEESPRVRVSDVNILHYALVRPQVQRAKCCMYSVLENVNQTANLLQRRARYASNFNYARKGSVEPVLPGWLRGWEEAGIDMRTVEDTPHSWHCDEVLRIFAEHGVRRFLNEPIWDVDWRVRLEHAQRDGRDFPSLVSIRPPSKLRSTALACADNLYKLARSVRDQTRTRLQF